MNPPRGNEIEPGRNRRRPALALCALLLISGCASPPSASPGGGARNGGRGALVAAVLDTLAREIPDLALPAPERETYRARALAAGSLAEERAVAAELLERIPASHLALFSGYAKRIFEAELSGRDTPTIGFFLAGIGGELVVSGVLAGTPAAAAGVRRGDRLIAIDAVPAERSPRLDDRHDDAAVPEEESRLLRVAEGDLVTARFGRRGAIPAEYEVELRASLWSSLRSDRLGARIVERDGVRVGILPFSYIYSRESSRLLLEALAGPLRGADALLIDLRGRGGSAIALVVLTAMLRNPTVVGDLPIVLAIDRRTRSAKEVLARDLRESDRVTLVGERTAGAVLPARWHALVEDTWLLCPRGSAGSDPYGLEGKGVAPEIEVEDPFPAGDGSDPILEAAIGEAARRGVARRLVIRAARGSRRGRGSRRDRTRSPARANGSAGGPSR